jgi:hypothetical protein
VKVRAQARQQRRAQLEATGPEDGVLRLLAMVCCVSIVAACGEEGVCGVDQIGNDVPVCRPEAPGELEFCPGDHWSTEACESCSCLTNGRILCGEPDPECSAGG